MMASRELCEESVRSFANQWRIPTSCEDKLSNLNLRTHELDLLEAQKDSHQSAKTLARPSRPALFLAVLSRQPKMSNMPRNGSQPYASSSCLAYKSCRPLRLHYTRSQHCYSLPKQICLTLQGCQDRCAFSACRCELCCLLRCSCD